MENICNRCGRPFYNDIKTTCIPQLCECVQLISIKYDYDPEEELDPLFIDMVNAYHDYTGYGTLGDINKAVERYVDSRIERYFSGAGGSKLED
jgi:hypothetical protein